MFRTLFVMLIPMIWISGCQSYHADLNLPANIERIKVETITGNNPAYGQLITDHLKHELAKAFTVTDEDPDLILSGAITQTTLSTWGEAVFTLRTQSKEIGTISTIQSLLFPESAKKIAKRVKNILTKAR